MAKKGPKMAKKWPKNFVKFCIFLLRKSIKHRPNISRKTLNEGGVGSHVVQGCRRVGLHVTRGAGIKVDYINRTEL